MPDTPESLPRIPPPRAAAPTASAEFARLVEIMRILRSPDGCPWDREQTYRTLAPFVLEEAYEVVDAIERDDVRQLRSEIGDLVFEGVFLAQLGADRQEFAIADALRDVCEKLIRRHPHVFADAESDAASVTTPRQVVQQWQEIKARERAEAGETRDSALDGLPAALPALVMAHELGTRAARTGFDWPDADMVLDKVEEEIAELREQTRPRQDDALAEELGDLLFALVQFARKAGLQAETVLRQANRKFGARFRALEQDVLRDGGAMTTLSLDDLERRWQRLKAQSSGSSSNDGQ